MRSSFLTAVCLLLWGAPAAQQPALQRTFAAGATCQYRVRLVVRTEVEGQRPVKIGVQTYAEPFSRAAEAQLEWQATRRVVSLNADGTANIEETLSQFSSVQATPTPEEDDPEAQKLADALGEALRRWVGSGNAGAGPRILSYVESRAGGLSALRPDAVPFLDEAPPLLLTPWLLRALRPAATLPAQPIRFDQRWQEPRAVELQNWRNAQGVESGEWLPALESPESAVRLHVVQQIAGGVAAGPDKPQEGTAEGRFHGESLVTLSLMDAHVMTATRSAVREITWTLPAPGLPEAPRFRGRMTVQVEIYEVR
jgi:hypothetical protein